MRWYLVYIDGPALINDVYYPESRRLALGVFADNVKQARHYAETLCPIERCDAYHIVRDDDINGTRAYAAQLAWFEAEDDFRELLDAMLAE